MGLFKPTTRKVDATKVNVPSQFKGTRYEQLAANNPWLQMEYTQSPWDSLKEAFGFRSGAQAQLDEWAANANTYNQQLLEALGEEQYNSAAAQEARMKAAGINTDLTGDITAGQATEIDNQASQIQMEKANEVVEAHNALKAGWDIGMTAINILNGGATAILGAAQKFADISTTFGSRDKQIIEIAEQLYKDHINGKGELTLPGIGEIFADYEETGEEDENGIKPAIKISPEAKSKFMNSPWIRSIAKTKRERNLLWYTLVSKRESYGADLPAARKDEEAAEIEFNIGKAQRAGKDRETIRTVLHDVFSAEVDVQKAISQYNKDYYDHLNKKETRKLNNGTAVTWSGGEVAAERKMQQDQLDKDIITLEQSVYHTYNELIKKQLENIKNATSDAERYEYIYFMDCLFNHIKKSEKGEAGLSNQLGTLNDWIGNIKF